MSKRTREVWHCDVCGWEWLPDTNKIPERCPNRKCRKRNWNVIQPVAAPQGYLMEVPESKRSAFVEGYWESIAEGWMRSDDC